MMLAQFHFKPGGSPWEPPGVWGRTNPHGSRAQDRMEFAWAEVGRHTY
jgi:hypothetical protein